jgi:predicted methyltransferase
LPETKKRREEIMSLQLARVFLLTLLLPLAACNTLTPAPDYSEIVRSADRSDADRELDQRRKPELLLTFYGVRPGMRVLDVSAGRGYNAELLARAVGSSGRVYAHNSPSLPAAARTAFDERLKKPFMSNVTHVLREFDDPIPPDVRGLDLITFNFNYHDTVHLGVDRPRMNKALYQALKPGGILIVADHSARPGAGSTVTKSLHRIEEIVVRNELAAAGFKLLDSADFLRNPSDPRDVTVFKNTVPNDEFVLKFVKPPESK